MSAEGELEAVFANLGLIDAFLRSSRPVPFIFTSHSDGMVKIAFREAMTNGLLLQMEQSARHTDSGWVAAQVGTLVIAIDYKDIDPIALIFITGCGDPVEEIVMGRPSRVAHTNPEAYGGTARISPRYPKRPLCYETKASAEEKRATGHITYLILPHKLKVATFYVNAKTPPELYTIREKHSIASNSRRCLFFTADISQGKQRTNPYIGHRYDFTGAIVVAPYHDSAWIPNLSYLPRLLRWDTLRRQSYIDTMRSIGYMCSGSQQIHQEKVELLVNGNNTVRMESSRIIRLPAKVCAGCGDPTCRKKCSICKTPYCSTSCQKDNWIPVHRAVCKVVKAIRGY